MPNPTQGQLVFAAGSQPVDTSEDAADALTGDELNARRMRVLRVFATRGARGATADEIVAECARGYQGGHNKYAPRVTELFKLGLLDRRNGKDGQPAERRATRQGATAWVHVINDRGRTYLANAGGEGGAR
jgi:hypothetical protein